MSQAISNSAENVLVTLTRKVRLATEQDIADTWFDGDTKEAIADLRQLNADGLVTQHSDLVAPSPVGHVPEFAWWPHVSSPPDFGALSHRLCKRAAGIPTQVSFVVATEKAKRQLGGFAGGKPPSNRSLQHDIGVSSIYLQFVRLDARRARRWVGEDQLYATTPWRHSRVLPDAVIEHPRRRAKQVIVEIGGRYSAKRLFEFHAACSEFQYEVW